MEPNKYKINPYAVAILSVGVSVFLATLMLPWLEQTPTPLFTAAIVFSAWYGGFKPAVLSGILGALARRQFFMNEGWASAGIEDALRLVIFLLVAILIGSLFSERHRVTQELHDQREWLKVMLTSIGDAVVATDRNGQVTFINPVAERMTGWSSKEASGQAIEKVVSIVNEQSRKPVESPTVRVLRQGCIVGLANHTSLLSKGGYETPIEDSAAPIKDTAGNIRGAIMVFHDVSQKRKDEEVRIQLLRREREARAKADTANRAKDEFLAVCSHELRAPLTPMLGWARIMRLKKFDTETLDRGLEIIERNVKAQARLIEDLLDVSRISSGKLRLNIQTVELTQVINAAIETVKHAADVKEIKLESSADPHANTVSGDASRLQQVLWNLLSNAIKFTPRKGHIEVRLECVGSSAEISVTDNGEGITPEYIPLVFNRFSQAESTSARTHAGLGLGLAIVRHLIELHGGTVNAHSDGKGKGAKFTVSIPMTSTKSNAETAPTYPTLDNVPDLEGISVLVVDDEADCREFVAIALEQWGAKVTTAASTNEALDAIERLKPDVLVSDIGMPIEDGHVLIRKLRERPRETGGEIPAVAVTAYTRTDDRMKILKEGFQFHVPKPVEPVALANVVATAAGRTRPA